ncbi:hypothetical protein TNCV_982791 [Trichonephila clavipes]|nr:hypothetical protein TNCV_982791 [Trichonephila clavipes]
MICQLATCDERRPSKGRDLHHPYPLNQNAAVGRAGLCDLSHAHSLQLCCNTARGGRKEVLTPAEAQRYIVLSAKRNRHTTVQQVQISFLLPQESRSPEKLFARCLRGGGLYARRPVVCVPLTRQHRTARLQWCREGITID